MTPNSDTNPDERPERSPSPRRRRPTLTPSPDRPPLPGEHDDPKPQAPSPTSSEFERGAETPGPCMRAALFHEVDTRTGEARGIYSVCGNNACEHCGPIMKRRHIAHFCTTFEGRDGLRMITLTLDPSTASKLEGPYDQRKFLAYVFGARLSRQLQRLCSKAAATFRYVWTDEEHASGRLHLHALMECPLPAEVLRERAMKSGFGIVLEVTDVGPDRNSIARAAGYILKNAFSPGRPYGQKAIRSSEGVGYRSRKAQDTRRAHVTEKLGPERMGRTVFELAVEPRRAPRPPVLNLTKADKRRYAGLLKGLKGTGHKRYVELAEGGEYGVRRTYDPASGYRIDHVKVVRVDGRKEYATLAEGISEAEARRVLGHA
jgi:hypothetical protein